MSTALISARSGREAAIARRQALSAGKVALPPPSERVRTGERAAALPAPKSAPAPAPVQVQSTPAPQAAAPASSPLPAPAQSTLSGRLQAIERRRLLSGGKKSSAGRNRQVAGADA
jgi:hypothetical protein